MQLFFHPEISELRKVYELDKQESIHATKVLRKSVGDQLYITNGKGGLFQTEIVSVSKKCCHFKILKAINHKQKESRLTLAIAPTKNISRIEWLVEKSVELGVKEIKLFFSQNSERKVVKEERLIQKALSAMKQSFRAYLPKISAVKTFHKSIEENSKKYEQKLIAFCKEDQQYLKNNIPSKESLIIYIGPEGGFSEQEIKHAETFGFKSVSLGTNRLRTETAAIYCASICNSFDE